MAENNQSTRNLLIHQLQTEHCELRQLLEEVRGGLTACRQKSGEDCQQCLAEAIHGLHDYVEAHFLREEQGGWLEEAVVRAPHLTHRLTLLEQEHAHLRKQLAKLVEIAATADCAARRLTRLQKEFDHFVEALLQHEAEEEQLLAEGFNEDLEIV